MSAHVCKHDCQQAAAFNATASNKVAFQVKGEVFVHKAKAGMGEVRCAVNSHTNRVTYVKNEGH